MPLRSRALVTTMLAFLPGSALLAQESKPRVLSPRDTTAQTIGPAHLMIDYGRPSKRRREIFGTLVPYGVVWRTGANAATQLETTHALAIGSAVVPPGKYSIWTIPSRSQDWLLVINRQTGQWGTAYDPAQDLARIPIRTQRVRDAAERFTIEIETPGREGLIKLTWANTQALVPFTVR